MAYGSVGHVWTENGGGIRAERLCCQCLPCSGTIHKECLLQMLDEGRFNDAVRYLAAIPEEQISIQRKKVFFKRYFPAAYFGY